MIETLVVLSFAGLILYFWIKEWRIDDQVR